MVVKQGIQVARAILTGDIEYARTLSEGLISVSASEGRALVGACKEANSRWGCNLTWDEFVRGWDSIDSI